MTWVTRSYIHFTERDSEAIISFLFASVLWVSSRLTSVDLGPTWKRNTGIYMGCTFLGFSIGATFGHDSNYLKYLMLLSVFHYAEFAYITYCHKRAMFDSMLLNHGGQYALAFTAACIEHFFSPWHFTLATSVFGFRACIVGLIVRGSALLTAGSAFTHRISTRRKPDHQLVTNGIYRYMRHPGYCGWLIWVVSSQILAGNPICTVGFAVVTLLFFRDRISYEESLLESMFGGEYLAYRRRVRFSGVPFIS